jgi:hypothetical protein
MKLLALAAIPLALLASTALADSPVIPSKDFPAGAQITFIGGLDNSSFDTIWGTTGPGDPGFHSISADDMGRTGGWGEEALLTKSGHTQDFVVFASTFDTADHAQAAAQDMVATVANYGMTSTNTAIAALTVSTADNTTVLRSTGSRWTIYMFTLVQGTTEMEAAVKFRTHHGDGPKDKSDLAQAVSDALAASTG